MKEINLPDKARKKRGATAAIQRAIAEAAGEIPAPPIEQPEVQTDEQRVDDMPGTIDLAAPLISFTPAAADAQPTEIAILELSQEQPDDDPSSATSPASLASDGGNGPHEEAVAMPASARWPDFSGPPQAASLDERAPVASHDAEFVSGSTNAPILTRETVTPPPAPDVQIYNPAPVAPEIPTVSASSQPPLLFEVAWEVCWQLGGIYTVLKTKAAAMLERWGERYCLIGPYNPHTAAVEFEELPTEGVIREALDRLRQQGISCHYGHWLIPGRPRVILLDYRGRFHELATDKYLMWADHHIATNASDGEVNEVIAFGFTVTEFFRHLTSVASNQPVVAHFHEWMGGVAVPRIAHLRIPVATIFTTHATLLGRYLASDSPAFYDHLPFINGDAEANKYQILPRHLIEKAAAHAAVVFSTVSQVTAFEAEKLLGRVPEVILPNGLNIRRFAALHEFQNLHREYKEKIHEFVMGHFFPSYTFDLDNTLYVFTSGRYEYRNKGMDMFIEALYRLNHRLRHVPDHPTVVAFIITRAATRNINVEVLQNQSVFEDLRNTCAELQGQMGERLFHAAATGRLPTYNELLTDDSQVRLKRAMHSYRTQRQPLIVTHDLMDDAGDPILRHIRHRQLFNAGDDPVKIVFHPEFVSATSPLISLDYEQFVRGCHLGIFPSYYEPWGYTPMECAALGLPAITSDLSGFGAYVQHHLPNACESGMIVVNRRTRSFDETADEIADYLYQFAQLTRRQRIEMRNKVERLSEMFDWSALATHYDEAHQLALSRVGANEAVQLMRAS